MSFNGAMPCVAARVRGRTSATRDKRGHVTGNVIAVVIADDVTTVRRLTVSAAPSTRTPFWRHFWFQIELVLIGEVQNQTEQFAESQQSSVQWQWSPNPCRRHRHIPGGLTLITRVPCWGLDEH